MQNDYETVLKENGILVFVPGGYSMWPTLKNAGQSVVVAPKTKRLNKYDVALYRRDSGQYVLHRVIKVEEDGYVICGDSQFAEEAVKEDAVIGVMQGYYKGRKYVPADNGRGSKKAIFLYRHKFIKRAAVKLFYLFRGGRRKNEG